MADLVFNEKNTSDSSDSEDSKENMTNEKQHTSTFKKNYESSNLKRSNISNPTGISLGGGSTLGNQKQLTSIFKKDILASNKPNNSSNLSERAAIPEKYSSSTRVKPVIEQPTIECPICRLKFQRDLIERHASTCKDNGDDGFSIIISDLDDSEDDDPNRTLSYDIDEDDVPVEDILKKLLQIQISRGSCKFRIRRKKVWEDFLDYLKKPWFKLPRKITITFLEGEGGIDKGGPMREFFSCKLCIFFLLS